MVIDDVDRRLLALLAEDGRAPFTTLGRLVGLSADAAKSRYARLVAGEVVKVIGVVNPATIGLSTMAAIQVTCLGHGDEFVAAMQERREVTFLASTQGEVNFIGEVTCTDRDELHRFVFEEIGSLPGVQFVESLDWLRVHKWDTLPLRATNQVATPGRTSLDELDMELARLLKDDGRLSFRDLADRVDASYNVVRRRCLALLASGAVRIVAVVDEGLTARRLVGNLFLTVDRPVAEVAAELASVPEVEIVIHTAGRYQLTCEVVCDGVDHLVELLDAKVHGRRGITSTTLRLVTQVRKLPVQWSF